MVLALILVLTFCTTTFLIWTVARKGKTEISERSQKLAGEMERSLADAFVFVNRQKVAAWTMMAFILLPLVAWILTRSVLIAAATLPVALTVPRKYLTWMRNRRIRLLEQQLPDSLLMMSGALRAGASFPMALEAAIADSPVPISQELELLMREIRLGIDLDIAMTNIEKRIPVPDFMMVTASVTIAREVGGNLAEALESVAQTLRTKLQMEGKIRALTSQGRMQGIVMTCLPLLLMLVLRWMEPVAMAPLFNEPIGWGTLCVIAVMEFLGYQSINKITHIDV